MDDVEPGLALLQSLLEALELQISSTHPHLHPVMRMRLSQVVMKGLWVFGFELLSFGIGLVTGLEL
jgi:hypothetical protein